MISVNLLAVSVTQDMHSRSPLAKDVFPLIFLLGPACDPDSYRQKDQRNNADLLH